jgi:hypothetical protein
MFALWIPDALAQVELISDGLSEACVRRAREVIVNREDFEDFPEIVKVGQEIRLKWDDSKEICVLPSGRSVCLWSL